MSAPPIVQVWRQFLCRACGLIYDEEKGDPDSGIAPGTRFEDIPGDWVCPLCGVVKADFELYDGASAASGGSGAAHVATARHAAVGIVVVGAGIAGWSVVEALRALDAEVPITLVTSCRGDRYHKPELSVAMQRGLAPEQIVHESGVQAARRLGVVLLAETYAVGLSPTLHQLRTTRGALRYTRLVLAQGARAVLPDMLPADLCWRVNDLAGWSGLRGHLQGAPRRVAIVGAGMVGCELAEDFARAGHAVTLFDINAQPLSGLLPEPAARRLRASLASLGARFVGPARITRVERLDGAKRVSTEAGEQFDFDEIVAAAGLRTDARLARGANLDFDCGIVVDPKTLRASSNDVYALGDCISVAGMPCRFIEPIARQAAALAHHALSQPHHGYEHGAPVIRLKTKGFPIVIHGAPQAGGAWTMIDEDSEGLLMEQRRGGAVVARLEAGHPRQKFAV